MKILLFYQMILLFCASMLYGGATRTDIAPENIKDSRFMGIRILDQRSLSYPQINGLKFYGISDLAYDIKKKRLYMIGDQRGSLFVFSASFGKKIESLKPVYAVSLKGKRGKSFRKWERDSEGMALSRKGNLFISFEGRPKIGLFNDKGIMLKEYRLPPRLISSKSYRSKNKSLESLTLHPKYGILTAAEWPLKRSAAKDQSIYSLRGKEWHFRAEPEKGSAVVAIETMDDGNLLILERAYSGLANPLTITLKKLYLNICKKTGRNKKPCRTKVLAKFNNTDGWGIDNFEGLTRVSKNRYLMVSDDNDNFFQRTLLIYFEVL